MKGKKKSYAKMMGGGSAMKKKSFAKGGNAMKKIMC